MSLPSQEKSLKTISEGVERETLIRNRSKNNSKCKITNTR